MATHKIGLYPFVGFFFTLLLAVCILLGLPLSCLAAPTPPSLDGAQTVYLWNFESEKLILSKSDEKKFFPSSTTKIMTGLVAIRLLEGRLDETVQITRDMLRENDGASMGLRSGDILSYRDLLYGTICSGFNDAAYALAISSAGSIDEFVSLMNEYARELGARETVYTNPTGFFESEMLTTLADTAKIAKAAVKNELYMTVSSAPTYTLSSGQKIHNRNGLISTFYAIGYYNRHARGLIAGMTDEGGYSVATYFEYEGLSFLAIVMGATEAPSGAVRSYEIANELISYALLHYGKLDILKKDDYICETPLAYALPMGNGDEEVYMLPCVAKEDLSVYLPYDRNSLSTLEVKEYLYGEIEAPIEKGDVVGAADIFIDGIYRGTVPICAGESVEANGFLRLISSAKDFFISRAFIISVAVFVLLFGAYYYAVEIKLRRKRTKKINSRNLY